MAVLVAGLGLVACEADSDGLGLGEGADGGASDGTLADASSLDGGGGVDASAADTGPDDAGPGSSCEPADPIGMEVQGFGPNGYRGPLVQAPTGVIRLQTPDGSGSVTFFGAAPSVLFDPNGFDAELELYQPFWTEARLSLWRRDSAGARTDLALVMWSGSSYAAYDSESGGYIYLDDECVAVSDDCGAARGLVLVADTHGVVSVVPNGVRITRPTFEVYNGGSHRYVEGPFCSETPRQWYAGWIATRAPRPPDCADMQRDACIASERCVLWGSENHDPGYVCVPAQGRCEPLVNPPECRATTGCAWVPGDCYCPEGQDCFCAGEPAPKCLHRCGSIALCPTGQYCDEPLALPLCQPEPTAGGACELIPSSCAGVPSVSVCACGANGPQTFSSDCASRQAQASGRTPGACPP